MPPAITIGYRQGVAKGALSTEKRRAMGEGRGAGDTSELERAPGVYSNPHVGCPRPHVGCPSQEVGNAAGEVESDAEVGS